MTKVFNTVLDVGGSPVVGCRVIIRSLPDDPVYRTEDTLEALIRTSTDETGKWLADVEVNTDGHVYEAVETPRVGEKRIHVFEVLVGDEFEHFIGDLLTDPPGTLESSALTAHRESAFPHPNEMPPAPNEMPRVPAPAPLLDLDSYGSWESFNSDDGTVSLLPDVSGRGRNGVSADGASFTRHRSGSNGLANGLPSVGPKWVAPIVSSLTVSVIMVFRDLGDAVDGAVVLFDDDTGAISGSNGPILVQKTGRKLSTWIYGVGMWDTAAISAGWHVVCFQFAPTTNDVNYGDYTTRAWVDDGPMQDSGGGTYKGFTANAYVGGVSSAPGRYQGSFEIARLQVYPKLSEDQRTQIMTDLSRQYGAKVFFTGDSLTSGGGTGNIPYPEQWAALRGKDFVSFCDSGIGSARWQGTMASIGGTDIDYCASPTGNLSFAHGEKILVAWAGTNDVQDGHTAAEVYAMCQTYFANRRAAGWDKLVVLTMVPGAGRSEEVRAAYNALIRANWPTFADAIVDVAADSRLSDNSNHTYFQADLIHITNAGASVVAELVDPVLRSLGL